MFSSYAYKTQWLLNMLYASTFYSHTVVISYILFLQYTATVSPCSIGRLVFVTEIPIVRGEVRTEVFNPGTYVIS